MRRAYWGPFNTIWTPATTERIATQSPRRTIQNLGRNNHPNWLSIRLLIYNQNRVIYRNCPGNTQQFAIQFSGNSDTKGYGRIRMGGGFRCCCCRMCKVWLRAAANSWCALCGRIGFQYLAAGALLQVSHVG